MEDRRFVLLALVFLFCVGVAGCSTFGKTIKLPSAIPVERALLPSVVYFPHCMNEGKKRPLVDEILGDPHDPGYHFCQTFSMLFAASLVKQLDGELRVVLPHRSAGEVDSEVTPNDVVEAAVGAKYRIRVEKVSWYRDGAGPTGYGVDVPIVVMPMTVVRVSDGKVISYTSISVSGNSLAQDVKLASEKIIDGIKGPRCSVYEKGTFMRWPRCDSFALPSLGRDDDLVSPETSVK